MISTQGGAVVAGDVTANTLVGRDQIGQQFVQNFYLSPEQIGAALSSAALSSERIEQDISTKLVDILRTASSNPDIDDQIDNAVEHAFKSTVLVRNMELQVRQLLGSIPFYNPLFEGVFSGMDIVDIPLQVKYSVIRLIDMDKLHDDIMTALSSSFNFTAIHSGLATALLSSTDKVRLKKDLYRLKLANMGGILSDDQFRVEIKAGIRDAIDNDKLKLAITDTIKNNVPSGSDQGAQIGELLKNAILEAAINFDNRNKGAKQ